MGHVQGPQPVLLPTSRNAPVSDTHCPGSPRTQPVEAIVRELLGELGTYDETSLYHSVRVARLARTLGRALNLTPVQRQELHWGALLHDIGKLAVPRLVLNKPCALTSEERAWVDLHASAGAELLAGYAVFPHAVVSIARHHHDAWKNAGAALPLLTKIVAVADVYDALTSERPYKPAWTPAAAFAELQRQAGQGIDPQLVTAFAEAIRACPDFESSL